MKVFSVILLMLVWSIGGLMAQDFKEIEICSRSETLTAPKAGGKWKLISGGGRVAQSTAQTTLIDTIPFGRNVFRFTYSDNSYFDYIVKSKFPTKAAVALDYEEVCSNDKMLLANKAEFGLGTWKVMEGGATFVNLSLNQQIVTAMQPGKNVFRWVIDFQGCGSYADMTLLNNTVAAIVPEVTTVCANETSLNAESLTRGAGTWQVLYGAANIVNSTDAKSKVTAIQPGTSTLRWAVSLSKCSDYTDVALVNYLQPATITADVKLSCDGVVGLTAYQPPTAYNTGWTFVKGGGVIQSQSSFFTKISELNQGENVIRWTVSKFGCTNMGEITIVNSQVKPYAGEGRAECNNESDLEATALVNGQTGVWTVTFGGGRIADSHNAVTKVTQLQKGSNVFRWSVLSKDLACKSFADVEVVNNDFTVSAGNEDRVCNSTATLSGQRPKYGEGIWTVDKGKGEFSNKTVYGTTVSGLDLGLNVLRWSVKSKSCYATSTVNITNSNYPAIGGDNQLICDSKYTLQGNVVANSISSWSVMSGEGKLSNSKSAICDVSHISQGLNTYRWTVTVAGCTKTSDVEITNNSIEAHGGDDQLLCGNTGKLNAVPEPDSQGYWQADEGTVKLERTLAYNSIFVADRGLNKIIWVVNRINCTSRDTVAIDNKSFDLNAGPDQLVKFPEAELEGTPLVAGQKGLWTVASGFGTFDESSANKTRVDAVSAGQNEFRWTVSSQWCSISDVVLVMYAAFEANAGHDQEICSGETTLAGNTPSIGKGSWDVVEGAATFVNRNDPVSVVRNIPLGKTVLVWKVELNGFSSQDTMSITNYTFSTDAGSDITTCSATIQMNAPQLDSRYQGDWRMILGTCAINSRASNHTTVKSLSPGKSTMQWTVTDKLHSECSAVDYVDIFFKTPPLAKFDVSEDKGCSPMKVLFANTSLDYVDLYWIFGDGTSSKELKPEHTFNLTQGVATEYTVKLVVQSANFCTDTARHVIGVSPEFQMDFVANPNEVRLPDAVVTSKVTLGTGLPYYRWRFGDSAADQDKEEIEHKYTQAGTYVISLVGRNKYSCEQSAYQTITVLPPYPNPDFSASMDAGCVPMAIQFINQSTYATSYIWSFGDGKDNATSENPTHIFNKSGAFDVTLTATSQYGTKSITKVFYADPVPSVDFTYTPSQISSPSEVVRFANASKGAQRYLWDFGDGLTSTDENPIHQYVLDAVYSISLTAITEHGCSQFTTRYNALVVSFLLPDEHTPLLEIKAYPNPSTTYLNIEINQAFSHKIELEILSLDGKKLQHTSLPEGTQQHTERLQNLAPGTYILKLDIGEQSKQIKFLKQ